MTRLASTLIISFALLASACSSADISSFTGGKRHKDSVAGETDGGSDVDEDGEEKGKKKYTKEIDNSGANFQVKDLALLRSSVESCMGSPDMLKVNEEMLRTADAPAVEEGKIRFLLSTVYTAGDDVLDVERDNMVDTSSGVRAGIAADSLTDTYLRSLETVANVISHNCSLDKDECKCQTKDLARDMLARCLPGLDPETKEMDEAAEMLGLVCSEEEGVKGMRKAIASLLSSYAFASAR